MRLKAHAFFAYFSIEEAIDRTDYGDVWDVLQALSEQDEDLHATIKYLREQKGKIGTFENNVLNLTFI